MPLLEDIKSVATSISLIAVPIVVAFIANSYTESIKNREVGAKFVELAVGVLQKEPSPQYAQIRDWAARVIDQYSGVPMTPEERKAIVELPLPPITVTENILPGGFRLSEGTRAISEIVVRDTQSAAVPNELAALQASGAAYHYLIDAEGNVLNLVSDNDVAYHTKGHNDESIGIGLMHLAGQPYPDKEVDALKSLLDILATKYSIAPDHVFSAHDIDPAKRSDFDSIRDRVLG